MQPRVSVIIPVYNAEAVLTQCVDSVLAQTIGDLEIILVDDGSRDGSPALCDRLAEKDARVRVIHQPNQGSGAARNTGMDAALGEYLYFADADDYVEADLLEQVLPPEETAEIILFGYYTELIDSTGMAGSSVCACPGRWTNEELIRDHFYDYFSTRARTLWARLFKTSFIRERGIRFNHFSIGQDRDFVLQTDLTDDHAVVIYDKPYYHYVRREGTSIRRYRPEGYARYGLHLAQMFEKVAEKNPAPDARSIGLVDRYYVETVLNELKNVAHPQSGLSDRRQCARLGELLADERLKRAVKHVPLLDVTGRWAQLTVLLLRHGMLRSALYMKKYW